jgi:hypothetical protein
MRKSLKRSLRPSILESLEARLLLSASHASKEVLLAAAVETVPAITLVTPTSINENDALTVSGSLAATLTDAHDLTIQWGDGTSSLQTLASGQTTFTASHIYLNNPTDGSAAFAITVSVADAAPGTGTASALATVLNVAPAISSFTLDNTTVREGDAATLSGAFTDPGTLDNHTVNIVWGDGASDTLTLPAGVLTFSTSHQYLDDSPTPFAISATVTDSDGAAANANTTITVLNVAPTITGFTLNPTTVDENGTTLLTGTFTDPGTLDTHTVTLDWGDGSTQSLTLPASVLTFTASHQYLDDNPSGTPSDDYTVNATVTDNAGATGTASAVITVNNVAPHITSLTLSATTIDENGVTTLTGTFSDPGTLDTHTVDITWGDGSTDSIALDAGVLTFSINHQYLDDNPTGTPSDQYTIHVTVTDDDTGADASSTVVTVNNVAPVITAITSSASGIGDAKENQPISITGTFTDVGTLDTHTAVIDWGDGTSSAAVITETSGSGTFTGTHSYTSGGIFPITVTLTDDDTGATSANTTAVISGVGIRDGILYVIGTDAADQVSINQSGKSNVKVRANFLTDKAHTRTLDFSSVTTIEVLLGDGNDQLTIAGNIARTTFIDGGAGNDKLNAGAGPAVITGSDGDDKINGSKGRDILIGGAGVDRIVGSPGDDILIAGRTTFDPNDDALTADFATPLLALLAEWNSAHDFATRQANITGTGDGTGLNGNTFLQNGVTVLDASTGDKLNGAAGKNWYFDVTTAKFHGAVTVGKTTGADKKADTSSDTKGNSDKKTTTSTPTSNTAATAPSTTPPSTNPGNAASPVDLSTLPPMTPVVPVVTHGNSANAPGKSK